MKGQQTVGSQALEMAVNPKTLEVNWSQSKLKDMNQYANEFAVFLFNRIKLGVLFNIIDCVMP